MKHVLRLIIAALTFALGSLFVGVYSAATSEVRARLDQRAHPQLGTCLRCKMTWATVKEHSTPFEWSDSRYVTREGKHLRMPSRGMFPLCEECWAKLTPRERLPHYRALWEQWERWKPGYAKWEDIEASVLAGN